MGREGERKIARIVVTSSKEQTIITSGTSACTLCVCVCVCV